MAPFHDGEMSERLKEPVLKTGDAQASVGSNPTLSATSLISEYRICRSTIAAFFRHPTPLAGEPLRPLGYFCRYDIH